MRHAWHPSRVSFQISLKMAISSFDKMFDHQIHTYNRWLNRCCEVMVTILWMTKWCGASEVIPDPILDNWSIWDYLGSIWDDTGKELLKNLQILRGYLLPNVHIYIVIGLRMRVLGIIRNKNVIFLVRQNPRFYLGIGYPPPFLGNIPKHRKNCECCPGHNLSTMVY